MAALALAAPAVGCGSVADAQPRLRAAVDVKKVDLDRCYDVALGRNREAAGELEVVVAFAPSGRVDGVTTSGSKVDDTDLVACVTSALREVRVDPPPPVEVKVKYRIVFSATEPLPPELETRVGGAP